MALRRHLKRRYGCEQLDSERISAAEPKYYRFRGTNVPQLSKKNLVVNTIKGFGHFEEDDCRQFLFVDSAQYCISCVDYRGFGGMPLLIPALFS